MLRLLHENPEDYCYDINVAKLLSYGVVVAWLAWLLDLTADVYRRWELEIDGGVRSGRSLDCPPAVDLGVPAPVSAALYFEL